ncbi:MAG: DNA-binding protein, partial [Devosiaceae bacterium]|nr:DNA-binding protein [Devosiaceae bacterium]
KGALGLARKAGQLQTGATRVKSSIASGSVLALLTACDAASDGRRKMMATLRSQSRELGLQTEVPHFDILTSEQLGLALGQENVIHAALTYGAAAKSALQRVIKLTRYNAH